MTEASHKRSIVVWDLPPAIVCGRPFTIKLGIKCESGCRPHDWSLEVRDHAGRRLASAVAADSAWPATESLYGAALELTAPASEGLYGWSVVAAATACESDDEGAHEAVSAAFKVRAVPEADHRLTVIAIDRESQAPIAGAKVVAHPYRALTDAQGIAELALPQGRYRVFVSGRDYYPLRLDGDLAADTTIRAELVLEPGPSDAELWS